MKISRFDGDAERPIAAFESRFTLAPILRNSPSGVHVACARLPAGGLIGLHPAAAAQLLIVVEGRGWVRGADGERIEVDAGSAVFWDAGELHETATDTGLVAIIVEGAAIETHR